MQFSISATVIWGICRQIQEAIIHQYPARGSDLDALAQKQADDIMNKPNHYPQKHMGFKAPNQVFFEVEPAVALAY